MKLLEEFNSITNGKYGYLRLANTTIIVQTSTVIIKLLVPSEMLGSVIKDAEKEEIKAALAQSLPATMKVEVEYIKSYVDVERATKSIYDYFVESHPIVDTKFIKFTVEIVNEVIMVKMTINKLHYNFIESSLNKLKDYLARHYCNECEIELVEEMAEIDFDINIEKPATAYYYKRRIKLSNITHRVGKAIMIEPKYIADLKQDEKDAVYAGKIIEYTRRISKKSGFPYYVITIDDSTGRVIAKSFTRSEKNNAYDLLAIGDTIVLQGDVSYDSFSSDNVLLVRAMATCVINYDSIKVELPFNDVKEYYSIVKPYKYAESEQRNLFEMSTTVTPPQAMLDREYVVFDVETTGLKLDETEVIEIAAVRVVAGKITECFSTFCKPLEPITEFITGLTAITNDMVEHAPKFNDIFHDFYKFTRGAALVAHNASYDMGYVLRAAKELNYHMDNVVYDTINIAKSTGCKYTNYKLCTLCEAESIVNEGAHRAIYDAIATAKLLIKLADRAKF